VSTNLTRTLLNRQFQRRTLAAAMLAASTTTPADFTVVALPDTQKYTETPSLNRYYYDQTQWIVDNRAARNILFVTHLGDITEEAGTPAYWAVAKTAMTTLDNADIPYGTAVGNHDILYPGDFTDYSGSQYLQRFSPSFYAGKPWYRGASPSGLSNYQIITADGQEYVFLHLLVETPAAELKWAQEEVLNKHQDKPTLVTTHRYLFDWTLDGAFPFVGTGRYDNFNYTFEPPYRPDGVQANVFFNNFIAANRQIYMVYCGHNHTPGYRQISTNDFGKPVHELLSDFQDGPNGGDGYLRINTFRPSLNRIDVQTYSPTRGDFLTDGQSLFSVSVNFADYKAAPNQVVRTFRNGDSGYAGTQDTWVNEANRTQNNGGSNILVIDDDVNNCPGFLCTDEQDGQGLLRFDDIFQGPVFEGDAAPTRIPTDATISRANLNITLSDDEDVGNTTIGVYRMTRDWNESSNWNSMNGGLSGGDDYVTPAVGTFQADNVNDLDFTRTINVLSAVESWRGGTANRGFGIVRPQTNFNDDGIDIFSSEDGNLFNRPALTVEFTYPVSNRAPVINASLSPASRTINEGQSVQFAVTATDPNNSEFLQLRINGVAVPNGFTVGSGVMNHEVMFDDEGSFIFSAEVRDDTVGVAAGSSTISVQNVAPIIDMQATTGNLNRDVNGVVAFETVADDPGIFDTVSYAWDLDNDGQFDDSTAASGITSFGAPGNYPVQVEARDNDGGVSTASFIVSVTDIPANGDFDNDGSSVNTSTGSWTDPDDQAFFASCQGNPPAPPAPYTAANCLSAFDADSDGDIDAVDEQAVLTGIIPSPNPTQVPAVPVAWLALFAGGLWLRARRSSTGR
jgi:hypothetical protein